MEIRIEVEKVVTKNGRAYKLVGIQAEKMETLPDEYYMTAHRNPHIHACYLRQDSQSLCIENHQDLHLGRIYLEKDFEKTLSQLIACGLRLAAIRKRIREETKDWKGTVSFII